MSERVAAVEQVVERGGEADDLLRAVVEAMVGGPDVTWAGIAFAEGTTFALGPASGEPDEARRERVPISFEGAVVGELWADGSASRDDLEEIAALIAPYVLIGWDTGGETWEP